MFSYGIFGGGKKPGSNDGVQRVQIFLIGSSLDITLHYTHGAKEFYNNEVIFGSEILLSRAT